MIARRATRIVALALLAGSVLASGCGSDDDAADPDETTTTASTGDETTSTMPTDAGAGDDTGSGDGCDLVSDAVVSQVLGIDVDRREPHEDKANKIVGCIKGTVRQEDPADSSYVSVAVYPASAGAALLGAAQEEGATSVDGLGEEAAFLETAGFLLVLDGESALQVQVVKDGVPSGLEDAETVAHDVLDRLS